MVFPVTSPGPLSFKTPGGGGGGGSHTWTGPGCPPAYPKLHITAQGPGMKGLCGEGRGKYVSKRQERRSAQQQCLYSSCAWHNFSCGNLGTSTHNTGAAELRRQRQGTH